MPNTGDHEIVALKTMEFEGKIQSFVTAFNLDGDVLMDVTLISLL